MKKKAQPKKLKKAQMGSIVKATSKLIDPLNLLGKKPSKGKKAATTKKETDVSSQMNANLQGRVPKNPTKTIRPNTRKKGGQVSKGRATKKRK